MCFVSVSASLGLFLNCMEFAGMPWGGTIPPGCCMLPGCCWYTWGWDCISWNWRKKKKRERKRLNKLTFKCCSLWLYAYRRHSENCMYSWRNEWGEPSKGHESRSGNVSYTSRMLIRGIFFALKPQVPIQMVHWASTALLSFDMPGMARKLHWDEIVLEI